MKPFEYLFLRNVKFDYICPPICEALFSSTGEPTILLEVFDKTPMAGLEYTWDGTNFTIDWSAYPGALCYSVYRVESGEYVLVAECVDEVVVPDDGECYVVTAITPEGETPPSGELCPDVDICPAWVSVPAGNTPVLCGEELTISCEANVPAVPGAELLYEWVLGENLVFSETKTGASTYVVAAASEADAGTYTVYVTHLGCSIEQSVVIEVTGCGGGGGCGDPGDMPTTFMEDCYELYAETVDGLDTDKVWDLLDLDPGEYQLSYVVGYTDECVYPDYGNTGCHSGLPDNPPWYTGLCDTPGKAHSRVFKIDGRCEWQDDMANWHSLMEQIVVSDSRFADGTGCIDCPNPAFDCSILIGAPLNEASLLAVLDASFPDRTSTSDYGFDLFQRVPYNPYVAGGGTKPGRVSATVPFTALAAMGGTNEGNQYWQLGTGSTTMRLHRVRKFVDQPWGVYIADLVNVMNAIVDPAAADPGSPTDPWDGSFSQSLFLDESSVGYELYGETPPPNDLWYGFTDISDSQISGIASDKWTLTINGWWFNGAVWQSRVLWAGTKAGGDTAVGYYTKTSAWIDDNGGTAPTCVGVSA
jgi:hypothetical protein